MAKASTFEEVDRIVQRADLTKFRRGGAGHVTARAVTAAPGDVLVQLCGIWQVAGPIVWLIIKAPFIPKKWRDALQAFAKILDTICANA